MVPSEDGWPLSSYSDVAVTVVSHFHRFNDEQRRIGTDRIAAFYQQFRKLAL